MINQDIKDQIELCKKAMQKALGHMSRIEQVFNVFVVDKDEV